MGRSMHTGCLGPYGGGHTAPALHGDATYCGIPVGGVGFSGELVGVKEAAELVGKGNFLRDLASREDFPRPVVSPASRRYWLSGEIERYLQKEKVAG